MLATKFCKSCHHSDVRFPSRTAPRCVGCTNLHNGERARKLSILRPVVLVAEAVREPNDRECPEHLADIRKLRCLVCGPDCRGPVVPHHVRDGTDGGMGMKPSDRFVVPLCDGIHGVVEGHHQEGHRIGWKAWQAKHKVDLLAEANRLAAASPHIKRTEHV